jgi:hypothetical protein
MPLSQLVGTLAERLSRFIQSGRGDPTSVSGPSAGSYEMKRTRAGMTCRIFQRRSRGWPFWPVASRHEQGAALNDPSQPRGRALMHDVPSAGPL